MEKKGSSAVLIAIVVLAIGILGLTAGSIYVLATTQEPKIKVSENQKKTEETDTSDDSEVNEDSETEDFDAIEGFKVTGTSSEKAESEEEFAFPDSDTTLLTEKEVEELETEDDVRSAINYIYAKAGRIFKDETIQTYFETFDWYERLYSADEMDADIESYLTDVQYENVQLLTKRRTELKENGGE